MSPRLEPEHPASRSVVDGQGRFHMLGLSEAELRLECVRLVLAHGDRLDNAVKRAGEYADFVLGTTSAEPVNLKADALKSAQQGLAGQQAVGNRYQQAASFPPTLSEGGRITLSMERMKVESEIRRHQGEAESKERTASYHREEVDRLQKRLGGLARDLGEASSA